MGRRVFEAGRPLARGRRKAPLRAAVVLRGPLPRTRGRGGQRRGRLVASSRREICEHIGRMLLVFGCIGTALFN